MTTIVILNISGNVQPVECDGIARDGLLRQNILLTGCKGLDTEDCDGKPLETKVWSVHESLVVSYAVGNKAPKEEPVPAEPVKIPSLDEVEIDPARREQIRQARARVDQAARERRNAERAKREALKAAEGDEPKPLAPVKRGGRKPKAPPEQA
jgi:hypothetical protein